MTKDIKYFDVLAVISGVTEYNFASKNADLGIATNVDFCFKSGHVKYR